MAIDLIARLFAAGILGALIGFEREKHFKEAGLRTHFLVALGSALTMVVSKYAFNDVLHNDAIELDPSRIAAQVVSGIGFLGAGTILVQRQSVSGLTTAAGLWSTAGVGLTIGAGMYVVGICGTILILLGLAVLRSIFKYTFPKSQKLTLYIKSTDLLSKVIDTLTTEHFSVITYRVKARQTDNETHYTVEFQLKSKRSVKDNQIIKALQELPEIETVKIS
ncbi:MgtC/SapB family protein [Scopulibacillus cellulosilyticus]|uniref:MgtC/SapB family protein n=1 Tax=Scopulibacillus cellulosilyticus TaxID=2665665 RepID=A0ABW2PWM4_9BACL